MKIKKTKGLIAAPYTAMNPDSSINLNTIPSYANYLKKSGLKGAFVAGTTGEGMLLSDQERLDVIKAWISEKTNDFSIMAHVGSISQTSAKLLAKESARVGADAISIMGPPFLGPTDPKSLVEFCKDIASSAPDIPFYYYHMPHLSGVSLSMSDFLNKAKQEIPNLAGIKFTDNNFLEMSKCISMDDGKWDILNGFDELLLAGIAFGANGAVGSTYNFLAPLYYELMAEFEKGNISAARKKQRKSIEFVDILNRYKGSLVCGKEIMRMIGIDCGKVRKPLQTLSSSEVKRLEAELSDWGFFEIVKSIN